MPGCYNHNENPVSGGQHGCQAENSRRSYSALAEELYSQLYQLKDQYILIGHQDALAYGVNWKNMPGRSDVKDVTGSYPAMVGWDIGGIGLGQPDNLDTVPFLKMKSLISFAHQQGMINTISWHAYNPFTKKGSWTELKIPDSVVSNILPGGAHHAEFLKSLDRVAGFFSDLLTADGEKIPVIFRPFHENSGNWFWWGEIHCSAEEYKRLYQFTHDYLVKSKGLDNLLFAYSPDRQFKSKTDYLRRYPGDDYVDILGYDDYYSFKTGDIEGVKNRLGIICDLATEKDKLAAFTESGLEGLKNTKSFTEIYLPLFRPYKNRKISYILFWRNANSGHFYMPFEGHHSASDFIEFTGDPAILLLDQFQQIISKH